MPIDRKALPLDKQLKAAERLVAKAKQRGQKLNIADAMNQIRDAQLARQKRQKARR